MKRAAGALLLYVLTSVALFGGPILPHPSSWYVGWGTDPGTHVWFLAWWPHALATFSNPFLTHSVWAPSGYNLAGSTSLPGPSLVLAPLTALAGPVVSYNVLALLAPALSAWGAFLLCSHLTGRFWPSVAGGYVFGFSTYEIGQLTGHPNLALIPLVPVCVLLVLERLEGEMAPRTFVVLLALALVAQFSISTEVFLTMTMFGGLALLLALAFFPSRRPALVRTGGLIAAAYALAAVPLAPYLYYVVRAASNHPIYAFYPSFYSTDVLNFAVPTELTVGGRLFAGLTRRFSGNLSEQAGYVSPALVAVGALFAASRWRKPATRFLLAFLGLVLLASLGPTLRFRGSTTIPLPWEVLTHIPLVEYVLPARLMMYAFLVLAVTTGMWLAGFRSSPGSPRRRALVAWVLVVTGAILLLPNLSLPVWRTRADTPAFFAGAQYRTLLPRGANVLVVPYGDRGNSMLWQATTGFDFRMPEGYVSVVPPREFAGWPILKTLYSGDPTPDPERQLRSFLKAKGVSDIVLVKGFPGPWDQLFERIDPSPRDVGGVLLYRVRPGA